MNRSQMSPHPLVQLDPEAADQSLHTDSYQSGGSQPTDPAPRLPQPQADGQNDGAAADYVAGQTMRMFDQKSRPGLLPGDQEQVPGISRPNRIGHAEAKRRHDGAQEQQPERGAHRQQGPTMQPSG